MAEVEFELLEPNQPNAPHDTAGVGSIGLSNPDDITSGTVKGTLIILGRDGSKLLLGSLPTKDFGIAFYNSSGVLITKYVGSTRYIYDPLHNNVNIMQDGKLPDGSYGMAVAKAGFNVSDGIS